MLHLFGFVCTLWLFNFSHVSLSCEFLVWIEPAPFIDKLFLEEFFFAVLFITLLLDKNFFLFLWIRYSSLIDWFFGTKKLLLNYFLWGWVHSQEIFNPVVPVPTVAGFLYYLICITFSSRFSAVVYPKHISTNLLCWLNLRYFSVSCEKTVIWLFLFNS